MQPLPHTLLARKYYGSLRPSQPQIEAARRAYKRHSEGASLQEVTKILKEHK